jgi:hypothetical protein
MVMKRDEEIQGWMVHGKTPLTRVDGLQITAKIGEPKNDAISSALIKLKERREPQTVLRRATPRS